MTGGGDNFPRYPEKPALCSESVTAMSFEPGTKISEAFADDPVKRRQAAELLIDVVIAHPLLDGEGEGANLLHADPHAGNRFLDETTGDLPCSIGHWSKNSVKTGDGKCCFS